LPRKAHLLIVDDDPNTLASLSRAFRLAGHEATVCDNAARAVELLRTESFDVILSDVVMPGKLDGYDLARVVRERWPSIKIVLTSGFPNLDRDTHSEANFLLLTKPYRRAALARTLRDALNGQGETGPS